jgi:Bacterial membrane protein YfhO
MAKNKKGQAKQGNQQKSWFSNLSPTRQDLVCVGFLYLVTLVMFRGIIFNNAAFADGGDTATAVSYAHAGNQIEEAEGVDALWMPYFFSGMPTFGNVAYVPHDMSYLQKFVVKGLNILYLNAKWGWIIVHYLLAGIFMFFLMRVWKFSHLTSILAAVTFMLTPNAIGLAAEGHGSKLMALSYLPAVFLLTHILFEKRNLLNFGLLSAAIGTLLLTNHMQIVYYVFMIVGVYALYSVILDLKEHSLLAAKKTVLLVGALLVGLCISSYIYLSVYEYATYSIRGGGTTGASGGLNYDYATNWSWNPWETIIYLVPSFFGFSSSYPNMWKDKINVPSLDLYWGTMPFHTSTEYIGIIPILLAVIALVYRRNRITVFFAVITFLIFLTSFGKHFPILYNLLFDYLPFFNRFRIPSMILHLVPFTVGILAAYGMSYLLDVHDPVKTAKLRRRLLYIAGGFVGLMVVGLLFNSSIYQTLAGSWFNGDSDRMYGAQMERARAILKPIRFEVLWDDYVKFVFIFGAAVAAIVAFLSKKIGSMAFGSLIIGILIIDLWIVDAKFINPKPRQLLEENFQPDATIAFLKQQPGLFRVAPLPIGGRLFMDNSFAYHGIQSFGGYSPAKLKIYQTMLDSCADHGSDPNFPLNMNIINMLSIKYIIVPGQIQYDDLQLAHSDQASNEFTYMNPHALPRAFFVKQVDVARNQTEVFNELNSLQFDAATKAVVEKPISGEVTAPDSTSIQVTDYKSRNISISAYTSSPALLVLSEIYYPAGWKAYIDGNETEIYKTNYVLRSVVVPTGAHEITFKFDPPLYNIGWNVSRASWGIVVLCILIGLWQTPAIRSRFLGKRAEQAEPAHG